MEDKPAEVLIEAKKDTEEPEIMDSLYHRAFSINDKLDHLLFHHNHDVTGKEA